MITETSACNIANAKTGESSWNRSTRSSLRLQGISAPTERVAPAQVTFKRTNTKGVADTRTDPCGYQRKNPSSISQPAQARPNLKKLPRTDSMFLKLLDIYLSLLGNQTDRALLNEINTWNDDFKITIGLKRIWPVFTQIDRTRLMIPNKFFIRPKERLHR